MRHRVQSSPKRAASREGRTHVQGVQLTMPGGIAMQPGYVYLTSCMIPCRAG
jgi:hypothetical protein